jgi:hypothetical protein
VYQSEKKNLSPSKAQINAESQNFVLSPFPVQANYEYPTGHVPMYSQNLDGSEPNYIRCSNFQGMGNFDDFNQN